MGVRQVLDNTSQNIFEKNLVDDMGRNNRLSNADSANRNSLPPNFSMSDLNKQLNEMTNCIDGISSRAN